MNKKALFLDRDGVINARIRGGYVSKWEEFIFLEGVLEALSILKKHFSPIVVVTNQQGIAKELMTEKDLQLVHSKMKKTISENDAFLDHVYYCKEHHTANSSCRKPNTGMGLQAQKDFPNIDFKQAIMVGDSVSDLQFGLRLNMQTVLITTKEDIDQKALKEIQPFINYTCSSLLDFALLVQKTPS